MPQPILNPDGGVQYIATDVNDVIQTGGVSDETTTTAAKSAKLGVAYLRAPSNAPMIAHAYVRGTAGGYEAGSTDGEPSATIDTGNADEKAITYLGGGFIQSSSNFGNTNRSACDVSDDNVTYQRVIEREADNYYGHTLPYVGNFRYVQPLVGGTNGFQPPSVNSHFLLGVYISKVITVNFYATDNPDDVTGGNLLRSVKAFYGSAIGSGALEIPANKYLTIIIGGPTADYKVQLERVTAVYTPA